MIAPPPLTSFSRHTSSSFRRKSESRAKGTYISASRTHVIPSTARNLPPSQSVSGLGDAQCHSEAQRGISPPSLNLPPSWNVRGLGGCSASCWLPPHLPVHPPLTSLRSFAPPYASEGGQGDAQCHSERSEESLPPSQSVRGLGGC